MPESRLIPVKLDTYKPLREVVFETLREAIINGTLKPGERMMEIQLAEQLGVSRTPVREAIRKLELEGFVVMIPRKGAYVAGISLKDIADVFEVRAAMEALAAGLAAERITAEELEEMERLLVRIGEHIEANRLEEVVEMDTLFHEALYKASRNLKLEQILQNLREQIQRFRSTSLAFPGRMKEALEEHKKIVEAISDRNTALAQQLAQEHIENAENSMLEALRRNGFDLK
ncbi:MAG TPA: GntR family transcriptional regulator [Syntrophothermus lipocalidus]|uniref:Transcriptional regulator, GntR family n=1 Tax=Syntrophothermus lipocalidus (strain DSM 12680 / TGB-C1) TaxID=643648 RepID=D7CIN7_SYNLT|nr:MULTISPECIES: GntR family transcriptional regulator [Syntrophothermus]ADI00902.1 transcriptional regulator, GntR family [Syntrophothermus lipocalidus DSM 12680]NSW83334.1 GntR family transcriptional regulator [Syntrophothermus sp.]HHV77232.1 GntR family transcriptional regulator [Syntrophothermus lipocalidus]HOV43860.1 GntR family transcriptional regulator [Syntrophothermus lipocalidus]